MAKRTRRSFTPQSEAEVVLAILSGGQSMAEVCRPQGLKPELVSLGKQTLLSRRPAVFDGPAVDGTAFTRVADLERLVGQLTLELAVAKKSRPCCRPTWPAAGDRDRSDRGVSPAAGRPRDRLAAEPLVPRAAGAGRCRQARCRHAEPGRCLAHLGCPEENGFAERLMRTIEEEEVAWSDYQDFADARRQLGPFLDDVDNGKRIHASLGYPTPADPRRVRRPRASAPLTKPESPSRGVRPDRGPATGTPNDSPPQPRSPEHPAKNGPAFGVHYRGRVHGSFPRPKLAHGQSRRNAGLI